MQAKTLSYTSYLPHNSFCWPHLKAVSLASGIENFKTARTSFSEQGGLSKVTSWFSPCGQAVTPREARRFPELRHLISKRGAAGPAAPACSGPRFASRRACLPSQGALSGTPVPPPWAAGGPGNSWLAQGWGAAPVDCPRGC